MSPNEERVLAVLQKVEWGHAMTFAAIARRAKLDKRRTRLACRSLARKGFAEHMTGLFFDSGPKDGLLCGSGYAITYNGRQMMETKP